MKDAITQVLRAREGGAVRRCHTIPWIGHYDNAQHTYNMLVMLDIINAGNYGDFSNMIHHILYHDVQERYTGDIPKTGMLDEKVRKKFKKEEVEVRKRLNFNLPPLSKEEERWVRALDELEFYLSCEDQLAMGNRNVMVYLRASKELLLFGDAPEQVKRFVEEYRWRRTV